MSAKPKAKKAAKAETKAATGEKPKAKKAAKAATKAATKAGARPAAATPAGDLQAQVAALTAKMVRKRLFHVTMRTLVPPPELGPLIGAHLAYMTELSERGVLFASGPFLDGGKPTGNGFALFDTETAEEARALGEGCPMFQAGLREHEVTEWMLMEGAMSLRLNFADCSLKLG